MEDLRCCGSGTCIINAEGFCWCGQRWNGSQMCFPEPAGGKAGSDNYSEGSAPKTVASDLPPDSRNHGQVTSEDK